ncbi:TadE/TadG family type IV pilus assembly protein [Actinacidiphila sp. bgisy167]|uniref:TadE/TadG family type IV pilus assembly protein n=1 Tax=Actinacidiphila sp. bgisy167 TaxID=3413797 RepID=UPI003D732466
MDNIARSIRPDGTPARKRWRDEHGSAATELVVVTPLLVLLLLVAVSLGRMAAARLKVDDAAHQAARAASLARSPATAQQAAHATAEAALHSAGASCARVATTAQVGRLAPGGTVRVRVACTAALVGSGLPGQLTVATTASSVVDTYRGSSR